MIPGESTRAEGKSCCQVNHYSLFKFLNGYIGPCLNTGISVDISYLNGWINAATCFSKFKKKHDVKVNSWTICLFMHLDEIEVYFRHCIASPYIFEMAREHLRLKTSTVWNKPCVLFKWKHYVLYTLQLKFMKLWFYYELFHVTIQLWKYLQKTLIVTISTDDQWKWK